MEQIKQMKLLALDEEDLQVISSVMQDSVLKLADIRYLAGEHRLVLGVNRYLWEQDDPSKKTQHRARAVLSISRVDDVKAQKIDQSNKDMVLSLLCLTFERTAAPAGQIKLEFAGGGTIVAFVECIEVQLADVGGIWTTENRPEHGLDAVVCS